MFFSTCILCACEKSEIMLMDPKDGTFMTEEQKEHIRNLASLFSRPPIRQKRLVLYGFPYKEPFEATLLAYIKTKIYNAERVIVMVLRTNKGGITVQFMNEIARWVTVAKVMPLMPMAVYELTQEVVASIEDGIAVAVLRAFGADEKIITKLQEQLQMSPHELLFSEIFRWVEPSIQASRSLRRQSLRFFAVTGSRYEIQQAMKKEMTAAERSSKKEGVSQLIENRRHVVQNFLDQPPHLTMEVPAKLVRDNADLLITSSRNMSKIISDEAVSFCVWNKTKSDVAIIAQLKGSAAQKWCLLVWITIDMPHVRTYKRQVWSEATIAQVRLRAAVSYLGDKLRREGNSTSSIAVFGFVDTIPEQAMMAKKFHASAANRRIVVTAGQPFYNIKIAMNSHEGTSQCIKVNDDPWLWDDEPRAFLRPRTGPAAEFLKEQLMERKHVKTTRATMRRLINEAIEKEMAERRVEE
ncbi:unnamed protein product [Amoebophrya sp. A25]|nr:unnamed protein product [Amoebophrya sp. A25]|eukprot:GSA25T00027278001.1